MATGTPGRAPSPAWLHVSLSHQLSFLPSSLSSLTTTTIPGLILKGLTLVTGHAGANTKFLGEMFFSNAQNKF